MQALPKEIADHFDILLHHRAIPKNIHSYYKKWLRFYWDFCHKYSHDPFDKDSLHPFLKKLEDKRQSEQQQKQAHHAISIFYQINSAATNQQANQKNPPESTPLTASESFPLSKSHSLNQQFVTDSNNQISTQNRVAKPKPSKNNPNNSTSSLKQTGSSWVFVFDKLQTEIKIRHYSPKTLKAYRWWISHLQTYTKSKDYSLINQQDVIDFLSYLAVEKKVSASSQNQAFNALLFLFRHVLKKEFDEIKGVARAKRKPYIPIVLSREEIDIIFDNLDDPVNLAAKLLYGCGLRLSECLNLRVQCFNFDVGILTVHDGKGKKDRTVPIPETLIPQLQKQLKSVIALYEKDNKSGYSGVFLPDLLSRKYKNAGKGIKLAMVFSSQCLNQDYRNQRV